MNSVQATYFALPVYGNEIYSGLLFQVKLIIKTYSWACCCNAISAHKCHSAPEGPMAVNYLVVQFLIAKFVLELAELSHYYLTTTGIT